jgi:ABC-type antimicrobial peptide transport system permease subunit
MDWCKNIKDIDRICFIYPNDNPDRNKLNKVNPFFSVPEVLEKEFPEIESHVAFRDDYFGTHKVCEISQEGKGNIYFEKEFVVVDEKFMHFFDIKFIAGSRKDLENTPKAILLTETTAMKMFGSLDVIGKTFTNINDWQNSREDYTIRGVIRDFPERSTLARFNGVEWNNQLNNNNMHSFSFTTYVKLKQGADLNKLNEKLKNHILHYPNNQNEMMEMKVQLKPLREYNNFISDGEYSRNAYMFFITGFLVLLTAILNYIVFISGRALTRIRECGIRKVNGSGLYNIFTLFFTEALAVYLAACAAGFLIVEFAFPLFNGIEMFETLEAGYMYRLLGQYTLAGIGLIALLCLTITGRLIRIPAIQCINNGMILRQNNLVRNIFMTIQFVICLLFVAGSWFINSQNNLMESTMSGGLSKDDKERIFLINTYGDRLQAARPAIHNYLKQNPNVEIISRNGMELFRAWPVDEGYLNWDNITEKEKEIPMQYMYADANFVDLAKINTIEGRMFADDEIDKMVVNESFAKAINRNPIGMIIGFYWRDMRYYQVVGVIPDITNNQFNFSAGFVLPGLYFPYPDDFVTLNYHVKVRAGYEKIFPKRMKEELRKYVSPHSYVYVENITNSVSTTLSAEKNLFKMTAIFSTVCIIITLLGMYAAVVLSTEKRKKEITVRKIHGATSWIIIRMFCKNIYLLLGLSACIAFPIAVYLLRNWLNDYAIRIKIGILPFILLFLLLAALVTAITIGQIARIARTNPAETIN